MSLGFLTESALMPSKSKKIEVDSSSMIGLKAAVYQGEQRVKAQQTNTKSHRNRRAQLPRSSRDRVSQRNTGVEQRIAADEVHAEMASKEKIFQAALRAKTEIYNKLDFERKKEDGPLETVPTELNQVNDDEESGAFVEVEDEFGRVKRLIKRSAEYKQYLEARKRPCSDARPERFTDEEAKSAEPYAWSTGRDRDDAGEWCESAWQRNKAMEAQVEDAIHNEVQMSKGARVKSQWETKLSSDAKQFLSQIRKDTEASREPAPSKDAKDRRRELLRKKQQQQHATQHPSITT